MDYIEINDISFSYLSVLIQAFCNVVMLMFLMKVKSLLKISSVF